MSQASEQTAVEMKYTPGPWQLAPGAEDVIAYRLLVHGPDGQSVASMVGGGANIDETQANASLIAAAPELLEALGEVLSTGLNGGNNYRLAMMAASRDVLSAETLERAEASERAVNKAYAVIRKALGKQ